MADIRIELPAGACQALLRRPLPAVCTSANTNMPSGAPSRASWTARVLVESIVSCNSMQHPTVRVASLCVNSSAEGNRFMSGE